MRKFVNAVVRMGVLLSMICAFLAWNATSAFAETDACTLEPLIAPTSWPIDAVVVTVEPQLTFGGKVDCVGLDGLREVTVTAQLWQPGLVGQVDFVTECSRSGLSSQYVGAYTDTLTCTFSPDSVEQSWYGVKLVVVYQKSQIAGLSQYATESTYYSDSIQMEPSGLLGNGDLCTVHSYADQLTDETSIGTVTLHTVVRFGATGRCFWDSFSGSVELTNASTGIVVATCPLYVNMTTSTFQPDPPTGCLFVDIPPGLYLARANVASDVFMSATGVTVLRVT